jgi:uncharacterized integral membrane protein
MGMHYLIKCVSKMESSVLKRFLSWLIMLMVGLIVIVFSISNHSVVTLDFWPLPVFQDTPIYLPVLASGVLGFGFGAIIAWFSAGASRRKARKASRRASSLENDLTVLKKKINEHDKQHK